MNSCLYIFYFILCFLHVQNKLLTNVLKSNATVALCEEPTEMKV